MTIGMRGSNVYRVIVFLLLAAICFESKAEINPENVTIIRDHWGVPHIYGKTDADVAYGFAWAQAEDDFATIQQLYLPIRGMLGEHLGKQGAILDFLAHLIGLPGIVDSVYEESFSQEYKVILEAYVQGLNDYADKYPNERLRKDLFPIKPSDITCASVFSNLFLTNAHIDIMAIFNGNIGKYEGNLPQGSNAFAYSSSVTEDGKTYLVSNTHQPMDGLFSWYEAHLISEEGLNITGATFHGMPHILVGANQNISWTHTLNHPDLIDVFKLEMHPSEKLKYQFDGEWLDLEERKKKISVKVKMGILSLRLPVSRTFYWSVYGPTLESDNGSYYSVRFPAMLEVRSTYQNYLMNKAENYEQFMEAINLQYYSGTNVMYADKEGNIFYLSNALLANRSPSYDWTMVLPGDTSATLWGKQFYPIEALPQKLNPECGWLFNTNASPYHCTSKEEELNPDKFNPTFSYLEVDNSRSARARDLLSQHETFSFKDIKAIKYDYSWNEDMYTYFGEDMITMVSLSEEKYPDIAEGIQTLKDWDKGAGISNEEASMAALVFYYLLDDLKANGLVYRVNSFGESKYAEAVEFAQNHLIKHYGTTRVPLGELQRHKRGDKSLPIAGMTGVLQAIFGTLEKRGELVTDLGESYIAFYSYSEEGLEVQSVVPYGSSNKEDSEHYTDQMELFAHQGLKEVILDRELLEHNAERIYHPE